MVEHQLVLDERTNLLRENLYAYTVQDVDEPNLFRELYPYSEVPKVGFNSRTVPMAMPEDIFITDTTFRDGQQSREPFTAKQIGDIYGMLHRLGGPKGIIRQCEFFVYSERDREALDLCRNMGYEFPEITSWIRASEKDFDIVKELGLSETGILVSCSDYHIFKKMRLTRSQAMEKYLNVVKLALDRGIRPRCHFEDLTRADFYGFVVPFASELHKLSVESGIPIKIRCCDTLGLGVTYPGASLPRSVPGIIYGMRHYAQIPSALLEWHGHNDFYKVVTNAAYAWLYGCAGANCSVLGIGERTGNCPLEAMVIEYCSLRGDTGGMDLSVISELADYFENEIGYRIPPRTPFMGDEFNVTRAGIHADGLLKDEEIYNIFDTTAILKRPPHVLVDAHSGSAGVACWINSHFGLTGNEIIDKQHPAVKGVYARVTEEYDGGRTALMTDAELVLLFNEEAPALVSALLQRKASGEAEASLSEAAAR